MTVFDFLGVLCFCITMIVIVILLIYLDKLTWQRKEKFYRDLISYYFDEKYYRENGSKGVY